MGLQCEVVTFLIDSDASKSSFCLLPRGLIYSLERVLISGVEGGSFSVKILQETDVYFQDRTTNTISPCPSGRYQPIWKRSNDLITNRFTCKKGIKYKQALTTALVLALS
jgi:hypothetical protein